MSKRIAIGIDFGTLSARALLLDIDSGDELGSGVSEYPHAVITDTLGDVRLPSDYALQDPRDYLYALETAVRAALVDANCKPDDVVALGIDFTSSTVLPVAADGTPLCALEQFAEQPHAWCKLWKHHGAASQTARMDALAQQEAWIAHYGGKVSSEYLLPKALETLETAPEVYHAASCIVEAGDWVVWQLCGSLARSNCHAGFKSFWDSERGGYPSSSFLSLLNPDFGDVATTKLCGKVCNVGQAAGLLTDGWSARLGLRAGIPVAVSVIDAHASLAGCGIATPGKLLMIIGTSTCHIMLDRHKHTVKGINGVVKDGIIEGYYAYEAGQCCVGDSFGWYIDSCLPASYVNEAAEQGINLHAYLRRKAEKLRVGESGLVALDWLNGVRSPLMDFELSSAIVGLGLDTKPEEIYRALIEGTAYGARRIVEGFVSCGIAVNEVYATGGIANKDAMTMQIYADVLGLPVRVAGGGYSGSRGSAIYAALTFLRQQDTTTSMTALVERLGDSGSRVFQPKPTNVAAYNRLYNIYTTLGDYFGDSHRELMHELKKMKKATQA